MPVDIESFCKLPVRVILKVPRQLRGQLLGPCMFHSVRPRRYFYAFIMPCFITGTFEERVFEFQSEDHDELFNDRGRFKKFKLFGKNKKK